ncbi:uncharacterized protein VTP21DRAFT_685 [Calcarisporiella thermophila]|uniref:uncharacterized protein n=1 Tax=Calcarisporiella thermophila TaxID=911321 RepID=UPI0037434159
MNELPKLTDGNEESNSIPATPLDPSFSSMLMCSIFDSLLSSTVDLENTNAYPSIPSLECNVIASSTATHNTLMPTAHSHLGVPPIPSGTWPAVVSAGHVPAELIHVSKRECIINHSMATDTPFLNENPPRVDKRKISGVCSLSEFDLIKTLSRLADRPNPQINIGTVDFSCPFLIAGSQENDFPVVYASHAFERLTGYLSSEVIGRNCRFLQAPGGHVTLGSVRAYTNSKAVYHLKTNVMLGNECQVSLINYKKTGEPFMNLVTIIPLRTELSEIDCYVGLQADLMANPNRVVAREENGAYSVNYQHPISIASDITFIHNTPDTYLRSTPGSGNLPATWDILSLLGEPSFSLSVTEKWYKLIFDLSPDFLYILSLKGIILHCSRNALNLTEFEPKELVGQNIAKVCHPSDVVLLMRELKAYAALGGETQGMKGTPESAPLTLLYRFKRKHSGYMWMESYGAKFTEYSKNRKYFFLAGRRRPVYQIAWCDLLQPAEFWFKLSTEGILLYCTNGVALLGYLPGELRGASMYQLASIENFTQLTSAMKKTRLGVSTTVRHVMWTKDRERAWEMESTFLPGCKRGSFIVSRSRAVSLKATNINTERRPSATCSLPTPSSLTPSEESGVRHTLEISQENGEMEREGHLENSRVKEDAVYLQLHSWRPRGFFMLQEAKHNAFSELELQQPRNWKYEIHQLKQENRQLKEQIEKLRSEISQKNNRKDKIECFNCHCTETPEWRRGPQGPKTLCNACGLRYAKKIRENNT